MTSPMILMVEFQFAILTYSIRTSPFLVSKSTKNAPWISINSYWLVVSTPQSGWLYQIPNIWEKKCSKPPTRLCYINYQKVHPPTSSAPGALGLPHILSQPRAQQRTGQGLGAPLGSWSRQSLSKVGLEVQYFGKYVIYLYLVGWWYITMDWWYTYAITTMDWWYIYT